MIVGFAGEGVGVADLFDGTVGVCGATRLTGFECRFTKEPQLTVCVGETFGRDADTTGLQANLIGVTVRIPSAEPLDTSAVVADPVNRAFTIA